MRISARSLAAAAALTASVLAVAHARRIRHPPPGPTFVDFALLDPAVASPQGNESAQPSSLRGSTIAALDDGALVIDGDSGMLVRLGDGDETRARLYVGRDAAQLVVDAAADRAYVTDRRGDRVVVVDLAKGLRQIARYAVPAEPFGVALTPDSETLLVTSVADRKLVALAADDGALAWSMELPPEPRGVAISPDGASAAVTFLTTSAVARIDLEDKRLDFTSLDRIDPSRANQIANLQLMQANMVHADGADAHDPDPFAAGGIGKSFARAAFAATYVGPEMLAIGHQTSTPHEIATGTEHTGSYGGGGPMSVPIVHNITFVADRTTDAATEGATAQARVGTHQPRALAYDGARDILYVAGYGTDDLLALRNASRPDVAMAYTVRIDAGTEEGCGPNGIDVNADGRVLVFCSLTREVATLIPSTANTAAAVKLSKPLTKSRLSKDERAGRALFRHGMDTRLSANGAMACSSCHPEGRTDGLSWRIQGANLQTPLLAGRVAGTHPFKWDGADPTIDASLRNTVVRLGGSGITKKQAKQLQAFLETLPPPRRPTITDRAAVARGKKLFHSDATGCAMCHSGAKYTDRERHDFGTNLSEVDTPSLLGLASSAPYFHDGSAATLRAVLFENGSIHDMGDVEELSGKQIDDLVAFLETL